MGAGNKPPGEYTNSISDGAVIGVGATFAAVFSASPSSICTSVVAFDLPGIGFGGVGVGVGLGVGVVAVAGTGAAAVVALAVEACGVSSHHKFRLFF